MLTAAALHELSRRGFTATEMVRFARLNEIKQPPLNPVARITNAVSAEFAISVEDLRGHSRRWEYAHPRQIIMYLSRELTNYSWHAIASYLGGRDHTTAIYGHRAVKARIEQDPEFAVRIEALRERLG